MAWRHRLVPVAVCAALLLLLLLLLAGCSIGGGASCAFSGQQRAPTQTSGPIVVTTYHGAYTHGEDMRLTVSNHYPNTLETAILGDGCGWETAAAGSSASNARTARTGAARRARAVSLPPGEAPLPGYVTVGVAPGETISSTVPALFAAGTYRLVLPYRVVDAPTGDVLSQGQVISAPLQICG